MALTWFPFIAKANVLASTKGETTVSSSVSLRATPGEPSATSSERQVQALTKDGRRSNALGLITALSTFVIATDHQDCPFELTLIRVSAAHALPNDRGPPALLS
jgi:hypothetical protein